MHILLSPMDLSVYKYMPQHAHRGERTTWFFHVIMWSLGIELRSSCLRAAIYPLNYLTNLPLNMLKCICLEYLWRRTDMYQGTCWGQRTTTLKNLFISFKCVVDLGVQIQLVSLGSKCPNPSYWPHFFKTFLNEWINKKIVRAGIYILFSIFVLP